MDRHFLTALFDPAAVVLLHAAGARADVVAVLGDRLDARGTPAPRIDLEAADSHASPATRSRSDTLAVLVVPDERVEQAIEVAAKLGARVAIVFTGRDSIEGRLRWADVAQRSGVRLVGPAALGVQRPPSKLNASLLATSAASGGIALVAQSGAIASSVLDWALDIGVGFSAAVALGDEIDVTVSDVLDFLAHDPHTHSIVLYLEGVQDARRFMSALRGAAAAKPVVVLKAGGERVGHWGGGPKPRLAPYSQAAFADIRAGAARTVALRTHAGAMFGGRDVYEAALRRAGAVQVRYFLQLFATVRYLAARHRPFGRRLAIVSNGAGPAHLAADLAADFGVQIPTTGPQTTNPVILPADVSPQVYADALRAAAADRDIDGVMAVFAPHPLADAEKITAQVVEVAHDMVKPLFACWLGDFSTRSLRDVLNAVPVPTLRTPEAAVAAYATIAGYFHNQQLSQQSPRSVTACEPPDLESARTLIDAALREGRCVLTELESKRLLAAFRVPATQPVLVHDADHAATAAHDMGFPVAMKVSSPDIVHKSEVGGVALNLTNAADVRMQYTVLLDSVKAAAPHARLDGITIEPMGSRLASREVYVGAWRDPVFGPVLAFGAGGTQVEFSHDRTVEFPPLNGFLARRMIERTQIADAICALGSRSRIPSREGRHGPTSARPLDAVETVLLRVSEMVSELPSISEMDINPVLVDAQGAIAVDARIVVTPPPPTVERDRFAHLAIVPYPVELRHDVALSDGSVCTVRPIDPADAPDLQRFMRSLSPSTRYFRFFSMVAEHSPRQLARFTQIDYDREMALVAVQPPDSETEGTPGEIDPPPEQIIGVARYMLQADLRSCEFAIVVGDAYQGKGLGRHLMLAIIDTARQKGLEQMDGYVVAANARMLGLLHTLGFRDRADPEDPGMRFVSLKL